MNAKIAILSIIVAIMATVGIASAVFYPSGSILATGNKTQDIGSTSKYFRTLYIENITLEDELTDVQVSNTLTCSNLVSGSSVVSDSEVDNDITASNYYLKTEIDTQGEVETIWSVTLGTDSEISAANISMKTYVDAADALLATLDSPTFTTAFTATGLIGDEDLQSEDFGDFTCAGEDACTLDAGVCDDTATANDITIDSSGKDHHMDDNDKWYFGTGDDAYIEWDGSKLVIKVN